MYKHLHGKSINYENHYAYMTIRQTAEDKSERKSEDENSKACNKRFFSQFADGLFLHVNSNPIPCVQFPCSF